MRIAFLSTQWPGVRLGGIGAYTRHCAAALAGAGHEVHVITLPLPAEVRQGVATGVVVHEIGEPSLGNHLANALPMGDRLRYQLSLPFAAEVLAAHAQMPFDILEAPEYEAPAYPLVVAQALPIVTHLHSGLGVARAAGDLVWDREEALREALELHVIAGCDGVCAPSHAVLRETRAAYGMPDLAEEAAVIPLPFTVPMGPFELPAEDAPVLFVGRLELLKGAHLLARAAAVFLRQHPRARLRIVGPDTLTAPDAQGRPSGKSMAAWMRTELADVAQRAEFLGEKSATEIQAEMRQAAFVVIPSLRESYSYVCCEAQAAGRAVIVARETGAAEVAGLGGRQFSRGSAEDLATAMEHLWRDGEYRAALSRAAWERARALPGDSVIQQRVAFYERVIAARRVRGTGEIEGRLFSLPATHSFRTLVVKALAEGDRELHEAFSAPAELPAETPNAGDRLLGRLGELGRQRGVRFYLYGAGRHTARLLMERARWEAGGHVLAGLIDDHPRFKEESRAFGLPVISCAAAVGQLGAGEVVILSTDAFEEQFWKNTERLRTRGLRFAGFTQILHREPREPTELLGV